MNGIDMKIAGHGRDGGRDDGPVHVLHKERTGGDSRRDAQVAALHDAWLPTALERSGPLATALKAASPLGTVLVGLARMKRALPFWRAFAEQGGTIACRVQVQSADAFQLELSQTLLTLLVDLKIELSIEVDVGSRAEERAA